MNYEEDTPLYPSEANAISSFNTFRYGKHLVDVANMLMPNRGLEPLGFTNDMPFTHNRQSDGVILPYGISHAYVTKRFPNGSILIKVVSSGTYSDILANDTNIKLRYVPVTGKNTLHAVYQTGYVTLVPHLCAQDDPLKLDNQRMVSIFDLNFPTFYPNPNISHIIGDIDDLHYLLRTIVNSHPQKPPDLKLSFTPTSVINKIRREIFHNPKYSRGWFPSETGSIRTYQTSWHEHGETEMLHTIMLIEHIHNKEIINYVPVYLDFMIKKSRASIHLIIDTYNLQHR